MSVSRGTFLYRTKFPWDKELLLYLLEQLMNNKIGIWAYNITSYSINNQGYYLFEFVPEQQINNLVAETTKNILDDLSQDQLSYEVVPLYAIDDLRSLQTLCDFFMQLRGRNVQVRSMLSLGVNLYDTKDCIVVDERAGDTARDAIASYESIDREEVDELGYIQLRVDTVSGSVSERLCGLSPVLPRMTDFAGVSLSWTSQERLLELTYPIARQHNVINEVESRQWDYDTFPVKAFLSSPKTLKTGGLHQLVSHLINNYHLDIFSVFCCVPDPVQRRLFIAVNNTNELEKILREREQNS